MKQFLIISVLTLMSLQISYCSNPSHGETFSERDVAILNMKRQNLIKRAFSDLRETIWQDPIFEAAIEFMQDLRKWSDTVDVEKTKSDYQAQIDICLNLLNLLKSDPRNCQVHTNLMKNYVELRELIPQEISEVKELKMAFAFKFEKVLNKQRDHLYAKLNEEVETFLRELNDAEKRHAQDLLDWHEKFNREKDFNVRQHMAMDFPRMFTKDQLNIDTTCIPKSITDSIN